MAPDKSASDLFDFAQDEFMVSISRTMKIGLFGGSFDPVHQGHLLLAEDVREKNDLDRIVFIPSGVPPHKAAPKASSRDRLAMLRLALKGNPAFTLSDWEIRQKRAVYSIETADHFHALWPKATLYFLVGSDALRTLPRWSESARLRQLCRFTGIARIAFYSSTDIRLRAARKQSLRYRVPEAVARYIQKHGLYR